jgi:hypothetical protein
MIGDHLVLLAHNWGPSRVFFYRYPSLELDHVRSLGSQAHNLFSVNNSLATCSSAEGLLVSESGWQLRTGEFPRGLASSGNLFLVGLSQNAVRDERSTADGVVRVYDCTWRFIADYVLYGVGMVLDLLPLYLRDTTLANFDLWPHTKVCERLTDLHD